ncbi:hypothetical protein [Streptomyces bauhiniae]|uniref:ApeA N-terminal domain-containing protein n=1 Tax=Streptomyces bauhiniae TaxID=2340725 RepID=A0A7K3R005_9ACTN|nr:hypothetical protein [Streptomyces bauhiniae]
MVRETLDFNETRAGLLIDYIDDTPYVAATLTYGKEFGVRVEVPYIDRSRTEQFMNAELWFETANPPTNLALLTKDGMISLFQCRYSGHSRNIGRHFALGAITPREIVMGHWEGNDQDRLAVREFSSQVDGLAEWTRLSAIRQEGESNDEGRLQRIVITGESPKGLSWVQGEATMHLGATWSTVPDASAITINDSVTLRTEFPSPREISDHLMEQRKVVALLKLNFGTALFFRRHLVRDDSFPDRLLGGRNVGKSLHELISRDTFRDYSQKEPSKKSLQSPIFYLPQIPPDGLSRWANSYDHWKRFIDPAVSGLSRTTALVEDLVLYYSMSLEAAGHILGRAAGEEETYTPRGRPTTATYAYRCQASLNIDWEGIAASPSGLARALANNYNTIKHYDRGHLPDPMHTYIVGRIAMTIVRLIATNIVDPSGELVSQFIQSYAFSSLREDFRLNGLHIDDGGQFVNV